MNHLNHRQEFEAILADYRLSHEAKELLPVVKLVLLAGPSASGRNAIIERLVKNGDYYFIVSDTTRRPRVNDGMPEKNGVNYWFRKEADFLSDLQNGNFLEAEIIHNQQVSGISIRELARAKESGKFSITEIEIGGFKNILSRKPDTFGIFIFPPSFDAWMDRLLKRGPMPKAEIAGRLSTGIRIFTEAMKNTNIRLVINDSLDKATKEVDAIVNGRHEYDRSVGTNLAATLLEAAEDYLAKAT